MGIAQSDKHHSRLHQERRIECICVPVRPPPHHFLMDSELLVRLCHSVVNFIRVSFLAVPGVGSCLLQNCSITSPSLSLSVLLRIFHSFWKLHSGLLELFFQAILSAHRIVCAFQNRFDPVQSISFIHIQQQVSQSPPLGQRE